MRKPELLSWWRQQLSDLTTDRARIMLVIMGVVWGTLSLTIVVAFSNAFQTAMHRSMHSTGDNLIRLKPGATTRPYAGLAPGRPIVLEPADARALLDGVPSISASSAEISSTGNPLVYGSSRHNVRIHGVEPSFGALRHFWPEPGGRFLNEIDQRERRRVAFLGDAVARRVFGTVPPVGQTVLLRGLPFTVVGVSKPKIALGYYQGRDEDKVLIPSRTLQAMRGWRHASYIILGLDDTTREAEVIKGVYRVLGRRHRFDPEDAGAVGVESSIENMREAAFMADGMGAFIGVIAILGMLVALVGVANVMYVMVEERRREFGVHMALGARPSSILMGRVVEGLLVTIGGSVIGVLLSAAVIYATNLIPLDAQARGYLGFPVVSLQLAFSIAGALGVAGGVAGYIPARRASAIQPVEALREE